MSTAVAHLVGEIQETLQAQGFEALPDEIVALFPPPAAAKAAESPTASSAEEAEASPSEDRAADVLDRTAVTSLVDHVAALPRTTAAHEHPVSVEFGRSLLLAMMRRAEALHPALDPAAGPAPLAPLLEAAAAAFARSLATPQDLGDAFHTLVASTGPTFAHASLPVLLGPAHQSATLGPRCLAPLLRALRRQRLSLVDACFDFRSSGDARPALLKLKNVAWHSFKSGYTVSLWLKPDPACMGFGVLSIGATSTVLRLEALRRAEQYSQGWMLSLAASVASGGAATPKSTTEFQMPDNTWHHLAVSHSDPYLTRSIVQVLLNGVPVITEPLRYPDPSDPNARALSLLEGFRGQCGAVTIYEGLLAPDEAALLTHLGPGSPSSNHWAAVCTFTPDHLQTPLQTPFMDFTAGTATARLSEKPIHFHFSPVRTRKVGSEVDLVCVETVSCGRRGRTTVMMEGGTGVAVGRSGWDKDRALRLEGPVTAVTIPGGTPSWWGMLGGGGLRGTLVLLFHSCMAARRIAGAPAKRCDDLRSPGRSAPDVVPLQDRRLADLGSSVDVPSLKHYSALVAEILGVVARLLADPSYRHECLQISGFHNITTCLLLLPCREELVDADVARALLHLLQSIAPRDPRPGGVSEVHCLAAASQAIFLNMNLLSGLALAQVAVLVEGITDALLPPKPAPQPPPARSLALATTTQELLDLLKLKICLGDLASAEDRPDNGSSGLNARLLQDRETCVACILKLLFHLARSLGPFSRAFCSAFDLSTATPAPATTAARRRRAVPDFRPKSKGQLVRSHASMNVSDSDLDRLETRMDAAQLRPQAEPLVLFVTEVGKALLDAHAAVFADALLDLLSDLSEAHPLHHVLLALHLAHFHDEIGPKVLLSRTAALGVAVRLRIVRLLFQVLRYSDEVHLWKHARNLQLKPPPPGQSSPLAALSPNLQLVRDVERSFFAVGEAFPVGYAAGVGLAGLLKQNRPEVTTVVEAFCEHRLGGVKVVESTEGDRVAPLSFALPVLAGVWSDLGTATRERIIMSLNLELKGQPGENPILRNCVEQMGSFVLALLEMAGVTPAMLEGFGGDASAGEGGWEDVRGFGEGGVVVELESRENMVRDLALDTLAVGIVEVMGSGERGWRVWKVLLAQAVDRVDVLGGRMHRGLETLRSVAASLLQRVTRGLGERRLGSPEVLGIVAKVLEVTEERLLAPSPPPPVPLSPPSSTLLNAILEVLRCARNTSPSRELNPHIISVLRPGLRIVLGQLVHVDAPQGSTAAQEIVGTISHLTCLSDAHPKVALDTILTGFQSLERGMASNASVECRNVFGALTLALAHGLVDMAKNAGNTSPPDPVPNAKVAQALLGVFESLRDDGTAEDVFEILKTRMVAAEITAAEDRDMAFPLFAPQSAPAPKRRSAKKPKKRRASPPPAADDPMDFLTGDFIAVGAADDEHLAFALWHPLVGAKEAEMLPSMQDYGTWVDEKTIATIKQERQRLRVAMAAQDAQAARVRSRFRQLRHHAEAEFGLGQPPQLRGEPKLDVSLTLGPPGNCCRILRPSSRRIHPLLLQNASANPESEDQPPCDATEPRSPDIDALGRSTSMDADDVEQVGRDLAKRVGGYIHDVTQAESSAAAEAEEDAWGVVEAPGEDVAGDVVGFVSSTTDAEEAKETELELEDGAAEEIHHLVTDSLMDRRLLTAPGQGPDLPSRRKKEIRLRLRNVSCIMPAETLLCDLVVTKKYVYLLWKPTLSKEKAEMAAEELGKEEEEGPEGAGSSTWDEYETEHLAANATFDKGSERKFRKTHLRWLHRDVTAILMRRYRLRNTALEMFFRSGRRRSIFLDLQTAYPDVAVGDGAALAEPTFSDDDPVPPRPGDDATSLRDSLARLVMRLAPSHAIKQWPNRSGAWVLKHKLAATRKWQEYRISNFEYLLELNMLAGRSFNDLCQYPVFPWVLQNYDSEELDLRDPNNFRDLSNPMGAQSEKRLEQFQMRYEAMKGDPDLPPFMYGSHYSTAVGVVLHFLVRLQPFASLHRQIQGGHFDVADRLFCSIGRSWESNTASLSEVKELTPEWFCLPQFLENRNNFDLGTTQDGVRVGDVELPPWAKGDAGRFIQAHRAALESPYVSAHLHRWIDLIFGAAQKGPESVARHNVFFYLTYYGAVDVAAITDEAERHATELQIAHFGQCPTQLYRRSHAPRGDLNHGVLRANPPSWVCTLGALSFRNIVGAAYDRAAFAPGRTGGPPVPLRTTVRPPEPRRGDEGKLSKKTVRPLRVGFVAPGEKILIVTVGGLLDLFSWSIQSTVSPSGKPANAPRAPSPDEDPDPLVRALKKDQALTRDLPKYKLRIARHGHNAYQDRLQIGWAGDFLKSKSGISTAKSRLLDDWVPPPPTLISEAGTLVITAAGAGGETLMVTESDVAEAAPGGPNGGNGASISKGAGIEVAPAGTGITALAFVNWWSFSEEAGEMGLLVGLSNGNVLLMLVTHTGSRIERPALSKRPKRVLRGAKGGVSCVGSIGDSVAVVGGRLGTLHAHSLDREEILWSFALGGQPRAVAVSEGVGAIALHVVRIEGETDADAKEVHEVHIVTLNGEPRTFALDDVTTPAVEPVVVPDRRQGIATLMSCGTDGAMLCICYGTGDVEFRDLLTLNLLCYIPSPTRRGEEDPLAILERRQAEHPTRTGIGGPAEAMLSYFAPLVGRGEAAMAAAPLSNFPCESFALGPIAREPLLMVWAWRDGSSTVQALPAAVEWSLAQQNLGLGRVLQDTWRGVRTTSLAIAATSRDAAESVGGKVQRIAEEAMKASPAWISRGLKNIIPGGGGGQGSDGKDGGAS